MKLAMQLKDVRRLLKKKKWFGSAVLGALGYLVLLAALLALVFPIYTHRHHCRRSRLEGEAEPSKFPWNPLDSQKQNGSFPLQNISKTSLRLRNIVFAIQSSSKLWPQRKEYLKLWVKPGLMRGFVWVEEIVLYDAEDEQSLPPVMVSDEFEPSGIRLSMILLNTFRLRPRDAHWFVLCEDDTIFSTENLMSVLAKYDPEELVYIGAKSESHLENHDNTHRMAFTGAGIAISYGLAQALSTMLEACLERYPELVRGDHRLQACITELGVPLTQEPGFHQFDIQGNALGLLSAHPLAPFVSMHHVDVLDPLFPGHKTLDSLRYFMSAMETEPASFLQQAICYNHTAKLSFSISLGYVVQVFPSILFPRELQDPQVTFRALNWGDHVGEFTMDSRPAIRSICDKPILFYWKANHFDEESNKILSIYDRYHMLDKEKEKGHCRSQNFSRKEVQQIHVVHKPFERHWHLVPRRQCCKLGVVKNGILPIALDPCKPGQRILS